MFFENRAVYWLMWINIGEADRRQMTIWRMRIACWIPKAANTHSEFVMWINIGEADRRQMTIWRLRIACWIPKAANTHSEFVILIAFLLQQSLNRNYFACFVNLWSVLLFRHMYLETYHSSCLTEFPAVNFLTSFNQSETTEHSAILLSSCSNLTYRH